MDKHSISNAIRNSKKSQNHNSNIFFKQSIAFIIVLLPGTPEQICSLN